GVQRAVGLVGDLERREVDAGVERQRLLGAEARQQAVRRLRLRPGQLLDLPVLRPALLHASVLPRTASRTRPAGCQRFLCVRPGRRLMTRLLDCATRTSWTRRRPIRSW